MINYQNSCPDCVKTTVCTWYEKLSKLNGTEKKPSPLDLTVNDCEEFLSVDGEPEENNEE
jgi:hypothetical protein